MAGNPQFLAFSTHPSVLRMVGGGFFHGASNFSVNDPTMIENFTQHTHNYINNGMPVLQLLLDSSMKETQINSAARYPPPRCHPGTRQSAIKEISDWMLDSERKWNLLWLYGFAGVGKTAIAQTIGELAEEALILGAAFFFSRTRKQNDPARVFTSIAYQLATVNIDYRHAVAAQIAADPSLLLKDMRTQFKMLLVGPLSQVKPDKKLLIIVDGLDECRGYDEQSEIIRLIDGAATSPMALPVIWMICSRPEYHIRGTFSNADSEIDCGRKEIRVDDSEARRDIELFIRARLKEIAKKYSIIHKKGQSWPTEEELEKMTSAASGLFIYADTVVRFIGDPYVANPESRLQAVISFIDNSPAKSATTNPLYYLDTLYKQILSDVPSESLEYALQLLGTCALCRPLPILHLANLFGLSHNGFYAVLRQLYSVLDVPERSEAPQQPLRFFHTSFADFLMNPVRSGEFAFGRHQAYMGCAKACFGVLGQTRLHYAKELTWMPEADITPAHSELILSIAHETFNFALTYVWDICARLQSPTPEFLFHTVGSFDFRRLQFVSEIIPPREFAKFLQWLHQSTKGMTEMAHIIRSHPQFERDTQLINVYTLSQPLALESRDITDLPQVSLQWALVGFQEQTVAVVITHKAVIVHPSQDIQARYIEPESFQPPMIATS